MQGRMANGMSMNGWTKATYTADAWIPVTKETNGIAAAGACT